MSFGKKLRKLREESNISRDELAQKLGLSYWAISKYETGNRTPDYDTTVKIADFFNVSIDFLLGRSPQGELPIDPKLSKPDEYEQFFLRAEKLSDEGKKKIWSFLKFVEQEEAERRARKEEKNKE